MLARGRSYCLIWCTGLSQAAFLLEFFTSIPLVNDAVMPDDKDFKFFKAARNVTTHHSVLAAPTQKGTFTRPLFRVIHQSRESSAKFCISIDKFREVFDEAAIQHPPGERVFKAAEPYLKDLEGRKYKEIFLEDVMQ